MSGYSREIKVETILWKHTVKPELNPQCVSSCLTIIIITAHRRNPPVPPVHFTVHKPTKPTTNSKVFLLLSGNSLNLDPKLFLNYHM